MKVIPLVENSRVEGFFTERGLSLYIETEERKIIFDTGKSEKFLKNMKKLNIDIHEIDYFIISHGHRDHIGGVVKLLEEGIDPEKIIMERSALDTFFFRGLIKKEIGLPSQDRGKLKGVRSVEVVGKYKLLEGVYLISPEGSCSSLYLRGNERDDFSHEIVLVIAERGRINAFVGCCHFGIDSLIRSLKKEFDPEAGTAIWGGLHMRSYPMRPAAFLKSLDILKDSRIEMFCLGHCTGRITIGIMKKLFGNVSSLETGREYAG